MRFSKLTFSKKFSMVNWARNLRYSALSCSSCIFCCSDRNFETPPTLCDNLSSAIKSFLANLNGRAPPLLSPKKKIGNAVKRNKIKRRLRNIVNEAVKKVSLKFSYSYLVIAKSTMLNNEYKNIKETLFQDLEKIK